MENIIWQNNHNISTIKLTLKLRKDVLWSLSLKLNIIFLLKRTAPFV